MFSPDIYTDRIITGMLMTLLVKLSRNWQAAVESAPVKNVDHEILTFLQENYSTVTLEELAGHLHYTVPYCSRYVKKIFGCTFSQLLNQIRFQKADLFLKNSSLTVNQISKMLGGNYSLSSSWEAFPALNFSSMDSFRVRRAS